MATVAPAAVDAGSGLEIFQEVLQRLIRQRPLEETLDLISRRVCELGAFDFCGIVLLGAEGDHVRVAASHAFPPRYVKRLNEIFLTPLQGSVLAASPTASAIRRRATTV